MNFLIGLFLGMFAYGLWIGHIGGALLALFMAGFVRWARGRMAAADRRWAANPKNAELMVPVEHELNRHECECMRDRL